jgi:hypothetical protein
VKPGLLVLAPALLAAGCVTKMPPEALELSPQTVQVRQMQSRRFETPDEKKILAACVALLQDLEFSLEESSSELGLVVGSKDRSAIETGQVIGAVLLSLFGGSTPYDKDQRFRASIVTRATEDRKYVVVRATFQRTVWNTQNQISRNEPLNKVELYQIFFERLSKAVFLEAQEF